MPKLSRQVMLNAMQACDPNYDGKFWVGVRTTGIYCLPSCKAKLPLQKNVVFYRTRKEAILAGLRGCKRCKSDIFPDLKPRWLDKVIEVMNENLTDKIDECFLTEVADVDISTIRRYFKSQYGITPLAFHRKLRLSRAQKMIAEGVDYLTTAFDCGFESASGFRDAFIKEFGVPPGQYYKTNQN